MTAKRKKSLPVPPAPEELHLVPRVEVQAQRNGWRAGIFNFGKAMFPGIDYFNPGIIRRPDGMWLIVRRSRFSKNDHMGLNDLMAFGLDEQLRPLYGTKIEMERRYEMEHFEDPRAMIQDGQVWISCCNFVRNRKGCHYPHQCISSISNDWKTIKRYDPVYGNNGNDTWANTKHEKNWLWFWRYEQQPMPTMVYAASPKTVVHFLPGFDVVKTYEYQWDSAPYWRYGQIRGGTPPVKVKDEYWTFFHSSMHWQNGKRQYYGGCYAFETEPPYRPTRITTVPILVGSRDNRWAPDKPLVCFFGGALFDGRQWTIVFGSNDLECGWLVLPHRALEERMTCVETT